MPILSFNLPTQASTELWTEVSRTSAFMQAATQTTLNPNGNSVPVLGKATAKWVEGPGEKKHVSNPATGLKVMRPYVIATIIVVDKYLTQDMKTLLPAIQAEGVSALREEIDRTILGLEEAPGAEFFTFADADSITVTDRESLISAFAKAAASGYTPDSLVISSGLYWDLLSLTSTTNDREGLLKIEGNTINGVPFYVTDVAEKIGVVGAFKKRARWGTVEGIEVKVSDETTVTINGELVSLFETNMVAVRIEGRFGFGVASEDAFTKIVSAGSGS